MASSSGSKYECGITHIIIIRGGLAGEKGEINKLVSQAVMASAAAAANTNVE